jgi:Domain of unknown function (DUF4307)
VTETSATTTAGQPVFPPGRYGHRREPRPRHRVAVAIVAVIVAVAALGIAVKLFQQYGDPEYNPTVVQFYDITDHGITVQFEVTKPADKRATCIVRAKAADGSEVGSADVQAPTGADVLVTYHLTTSRRPVDVEVPRCTELR